MFKNYFKIAWRNGMKNKTFSFINILGLAIGFTCCMLISLYIADELNYDRYHKNAKDLYQLGTIFITPGEEVKPENWSASTPAPMAQLMKQEFPEIREATRIMSLFAEDKTLLQYKESAGDVKSFYETKGYLADSTFFRLFTYHFVEGDASTALNSPNTVVLSEEIAKKLFGNRPALNKTIRISSSTNGDHDFTVRGVFKPINAPSHIGARFFLSITGGDIEQYIKERGADLASNNMFFTYLLLRPGSSAKMLEAKFPAFIKKYAAKDLKAMGRDKKQFLTPLRNIHLHSPVSKNVTASGSVTYLYLLASIALFILLIACINFMNLSTARSSKRSAEVGIRKVLGAEKGSLIRQFLGESLAISFIAFLFAFALMLLLLPAFNHVSGKNLSFSIASQGWMLAAFLVLTFVTGLIAGSYPAFYLSSFKPVRVLKGRFSNSFGALSLRKALVVFQFVIAVVLIVASVVIRNQMRYMRSQNLGFDKDRQIILSLRSETAKKMYPSLKNELLRKEQVQSVGASLYYPGIFNPSDNPFYREGQTMNEAKRTRNNWVDASFLQTLDIQTVAGRPFSEQFPADTNFRVILNETAIKEIGFASPQQSIGKKVFFDWQGETYGYDIIGVVKDFHFEDLHVPITPYAFQLNSQPTYNYIVVHARPGDISSLLKSIETTWRSLNAAEPFEYSFLDADFQKNYDAEAKLSAMVGYFTIIAILISCLGLFGLASFSAEQRTKEIGIRKVMGATTANIVALLSKDFIKLVVVAIVIACPVAWYVMETWLQNFAYRTHISAAVFLITALIAVFIALFTVSFQAIKAALTNPVKNLRTE